MSDSPPLLQTFAAAGDSSPDEGRSRARWEPAGEPAARIPALPDWEDAALLGCVAAGDGAAFGHLYDHLAPAMYSLAVRMMGSRADAEDVLQLGFHQVWRSAKDYRADLGSPFAWITAIVRRKAIDRLRVRRGQGQRIYDAFRCRVEDVENPAGDVHLLARERHAEVRQALLQLDREERSAIRMAFFDGLTHVEVARILDAPVGTVKARIRRGLRKLRGAMTHLAEVSAMG